MKRAPPLCSCGTKERPAESGVWGSQPECCLRLDFAPLAASSLSQLQPATSRPGSTAKNKGCLPDPSCPSFLPASSVPHWSTCFCAHVYVRACVHSCIWMECFVGSSFDIWFSIHFWWIFVIFFFPFISYQSHLVLKYFWNPYFSNFLPTLLTRLPPLGSFFSFFNKCQLDLISVKWVLVTASRFEAKETRQNLCPQAAQSGGLVVCALPSSLYSSYWSLPLGRVSCQRTPL